MRAPEIMYTGLIFFSSLDVLISLQLPLSHAHETFGWAFMGLATQLCRLNERQKSLHT